MPSTLQYQSVFEENVTQQTDIKLAGETNERPVVPDATIIVSVTLPQLNSALTWVGNYVDEDVALARAEAFPNVTFDLTSLMSTAQGPGISADFSDVTKDKLTGDNSDVDTLQGKFKKILNNFTGITAWTPANIPLEAVLKVVNNPLAGNTLAQTLVSPAASSSGGSHPVNLYEQAVAANKTKDGGADFAPGDSISVYVQYNLAKTRAYTLDVADGTSASHLIAGMNVVEDTESASETFIYEVKFVAP
jgi:hypothetical protein